MDHTRYYPNQLEDYSSEHESSCISPDGTDLHPDFREKLTVYIQVFMRKMEQNRKYWDKPDDTSMYTGLPGIAYSYYRYAKYFKDTVCETRAFQLMAKCGDGPGGKRQMGFLTGQAGFLTFMAILNYEKREIGEAMRKISKLKEMSGYATSDGEGIPDELLYGRSGYLYCLLLLNKKISPPPFDETLIKDIINAVLFSGRIYARIKKYPTPIMYQWHKSEYLGGAHGLAGILYMLLQARSCLTEEQLKNEVEPAIQFLETLKFPSGNFPSSYGKETDRLVHWCHGAPGMTMLFCLAHEVYGKERYLNTALECGEVVWKRGLLKKGHGLCHGAAGNAYSFLSLYQCTKDNKHLHRACKFAEWCMDYIKPEDNDRPYSFFEGLAGTIYFLMDLQNPLEAKFPGYTV